MWLEVRAPGEAQASWTPVVVGSGEPLRRADERARNKSELQAIYQSDLRALITLVTRIVRNMGDAEDVVHDAFLRVWRAMEQGSIRNARAVLFKTAYNLALNHVRSPRNLRADTAEAPEEASDEPSAEDRIIRDEELEACRVAFARLPLRCRETLTLRVVDELSYKEMSERLGLSVSTLEKHFIRGRRLCRDMMREGAGETLAPMMLAAE